MYGGYQLNQNNRTAMGAAPGSVWTLAESAGLCVLCHSDNVNAMNQFGTPSADWVGTNGHSGAAIGGTATLAANIYREAVATRTGYQARNPNYLGTGTSYNTSSTRGSSGVGRPAIGQHNMDDQSRLYGFRSVTGEGFDVPPQLSLYGYPEGNKTAVMKSFDRDASANKGQDRVASVQQGAPEAKKQKTVHGKKSGAKAKSAKPAKDDPLAKEKQDGAMEVPAEQVEQSVQLKGVRG